MQTLVKAGLHAGHHAGPGPRRGARRHRLHARDPNPETRQIYTIADTDLCLIATAEITLGGMHRDQILDEARPAEEVRRPVALLPHRGRAPPAATRAGCTASTSSPRSRCSPSAPRSRARRSTRKCCGIEEEIFQGLGLPYHVIDTCTGDLGGPAYRKYDLEAWMPGRGAGGRVRRGDQHVELHRLPGPAAQHPLQGAGPEGDAVRPHAQRHGGRRARGRWWRSWRTTSRPTARWSFRRCCGRGSARTASARSGGDFAFCRGPFGVTRAVLCRLFSRLG